MKTKIIKLQYFWLELGRLQCFSCTKLFTVANIQIYETFNLIQLSIKYFLVVSLRFNKSFFNSNKVSYKGKFI